MKNLAQNRKLKKAAQITLLLASIFAATYCFSENSFQIPNIFNPQSTPAESIKSFSFLILTITCTIFLIVFSLIIYIITKFRRRKDDQSEPPQVYGSNHIELAWTIIPVIIVLVMFMATARVIHSIQDAPQP